jgi:phage recombination protein Bet
MLSTLKATAFKQRESKDGTVRDITNEEMMALLVIADQYHLNPFTKELYAFLDRKSGGIVPVVSVDGWARIINEHPQLDGIAFAYPDQSIKFKGKGAFEWIECSIYRKDRAHPTIIREYFDEVCRNESFATPWDSHPKRMHRHKTLIQCARVAFGFAGIYDPDEAERIVEGERIEVIPAKKTGTEALKARLAAQNPDQAAITADSLPAARSDSGPDYARGVEGQETVTGQRLKADLETGEIMPTIVDVRAAINRGDFDAAADIARSLPDNTEALLEVSVAHAKAKKS